MHVTWQIMMLFGFCVQCKITLNQRFSNSFYRGPLFFLSLLADPHICAVKFTTTYLLIRIHTAYCKLVGNTNGIREVGTVGYIGHTYSNTT
jgi:hypothetical protein